MEPAGPVEEPKGHPTRADRDLGGLVVAVHGVMAAFCSAYAVTRSLLVTTVAGLIAICLVALLAIRR